MIDADLAGRLRALVGLRNRLVHLYEEIDDALVFRSVPESLDDLDAFARAVARLVRCTSRDRGKQRRSSSSPPSARFRHDQRGDGERVKSHHPAPPPGLGSRRLYATADLDDRVPDARGRRFEVDVVPREPERFAASHTGHDEHDPQDLELVTLDRL